MTNESIAPPALLFAARARRSSFRLPHNEGSGAPSGASTSPRQRKQVYAVCATRLHLEARRALGEGRTPPGAPLAAFLSPGPCFRPLDGELFALPSRAAFAAPRPCPSSHSRQPHVVGADGYPGPPGRMLAKHPRGRRTRLHHIDASRWRPSANRARGR